jgi:hypothetical protein
MLVTCFSTARSVHDELFRYRVVRAAFGHQLEDLPLTRGELRQWVAPVHVGSRAPRAYAATVPVAMGDRVAEPHWRAALAYCGRREHLRRTVRIASAVGVVLTSINQLDVILSGAATTLTWLKCGMNFVVPFIVSNLGLLSGRRSETGVPLSDDPGTAGFTSRRRWVCLSAEP